MRTAQAAASANRAVVITGQAESAPLVQEAIKEGVDAVCYKPLDVARLLQVLDRLVR